MEINFLAVAIAAVAGFAIGGVWFGPKTFFLIAGFAKKDEFQGVIGSSW